MALSARTPTTTKTNYFIPAIYANRVVKAAKKKMVAWDAIDSTWETELKKGDTLYIPKTNVVTATVVVVGTKGTALNPLNTTGVTLSIDQWYEAPVDVDTMSMRQRGADIEGASAEEAAYAIKITMDSSVCALFSTLGSYSTAGYGADGQQLDDDIMLYLKETLDEADVPMEDGLRSLIIDPSALSDLLKIDKLLSATYGAKGALGNGIMGQSIYGCTVRVTNNLTEATTGAYAAMLHKKAIAGAAQIEKTWMKDFEELHQRRYQSEALWGVIEVLDAWGVPFYTRKK